MASPVDGFRSDDNPHEAKEDCAPSRRARGRRRYRSPTSGVRGYRIDVVAGTVEDLVQSAGGWLFDRIITGWTVNVVMNTQTDMRPLQILGVSTVSTRVSGVSTPGIVHRLVVSADLLARDPAVREDLVAVLERGSDEFMLWGEMSPDGLPGRNVTTEQHCVSNAARMFKAHALQAVSLPHEWVGPTETLHRCTRRG